MADLARALRVYSHASSYMMSATLRPQVEWQDSVDLRELTEADLLCETAWVILCSGFREATVRRIFDYVSLCFCDWESAAAIVASSRGCQLAAEKAFGNRRKLAAISQVATIINDEGFEAIKSDILSDPIRALSQFPFIGPVTVWHLAKNLGLDVAKPDRHLVRISRQLGFESAKHLCHSIAEAHGHTLRVVDLTIWRFLADHGVDHAWELLCAE